MSDRSIEIIQVRLVEQASNPTAPVAGDVQMFAKTDGNIYIQNNGGNVHQLAYATGSYDSTNVAITGGTINNTTIGLTTPAAANVTTLNATGNITAPYFIGNGALLTGMPPAGITQLTGDATAGPGSGSQAITFATVNANVGTFGNATYVPTITVNAKGLVTAASQTAVSVPSGSINVTGSDLTMSGTTGTNITNATLVNTAVTPSQYGDGTHVSQITVDAKGRITTASNVAIVSNYNPANVAITGGSISGLSSFIMSNVLVDTGFIESSHQIIAPTGTIGQGTGLLTVNGTISSLGGIEEICSDPFNRFVYLARNLSNDVYQYSINQNTGLLTFVANIAAGTSPNTLTVDPSGRFLYVQASGLVNQFSIDQTTGNLSVITTPISAGGGTADIVCHPNGQFVYTTSSINYLNWYSINQTTGALSLITSSNTSGGGLCIAIDPSGRFVYVGVNNNTIEQFSVNQATGALSTITTPLNTGLGNPYSMVVDPSGRFVFVTQSNGSVYTYSINQITGALTQVTGIAGPVADGPGDLKVDPTGKFLYVIGSASSTTGVWIYSINQSSGKLTYLTLAAISSIGPGASVTITPNGNFLYASTGTNGFGGQIIEYVINNFSAGSGTFYGNISAGNFSGNSSGTNTGDQNLSGYALLTGATFSGNVTAPNFIGNVVGTTGTFSGNVSANYYSGNGSLLTNVTQTTVPSNAQTGTTYTLVLGDAGKFLTFSNASAISVTVPTNANVAFTTDTQIQVCQYGAGKVTFVGQTANVVILSQSNNKSLAAQYAGALLQKTPTADTWLLIGNLAP